jgi:catechol 2,3-dioxygenase-like lactoylglutathione lyase family enzyme
MPDITGLDHISLTVRDLDRSADWYSELFGFTKLGQVPDDGKSGAKALLYHPASKLVLGLSQHQRNPGEPFSEFRTGLDHLALAASSRDELEAWSQKLDERGVKHSEIQPGVRGDLIVFRDPDNIQIEVYARAPS